MTMRYVMLFPGQGAQYLHMCCHLYEKSVETRKIFETASQILGYDLWDMIENGDMKTLTKSKNAQPAVLTASFALYHHFIKMYEKKPEIVVGHSLGEISALVCSGSILFEEALSFVKRRGELMEEAFLKKLGFSGIVTNLSQKNLEKVIMELKEEGYVAITSYNSPNQFMVGGVRKIEKLLDDKIEEWGGQYIPHRMIPMKVDAPYHSKQMNVFQKDFEEIVQGIHFFAPSIPVFSTVCKDFIQNTEEISRWLVKQISSPVLWNQAIEEISKKNYDAYIDIGPNRIMKNLIEENPKILPVFGADNEDEEKKISSLFLQATS